LQVAHYEERIVTLEFSLCATQEQLSLRNGELVKLDQSSKKLQTELKIMKERNTSYEEEIGDLKRTTGF